MQLADELKCLEIEEADFGRAGKVEGDDDPAFGDRCGVDVRALGQEHGAIDDGVDDAVAAVEEPIADDADHGCDRNRRGQRRYDHEPAHARDSGSQVIGGLAICG